MLRPDGMHKKNGLPKHRKEYRAFRRNNAITWQGVEPDKRIEHPRLTPVRSERGEIHYVEVSVY